MSDETYLESFIEHLTTLPHDARRNLELIKDLDKSCSALVTELTQRQQEYIAATQEKVLQLKLSTTPDGKPGVQVLQSANNTTSPAKKRKKSKHPQEAVAVIPTTEELSAFCHDGSSWRKIKELEKKAVQQADEKVAIAQQNYSLVDATVKRLDADLARMEALLKSTGELEDSSGGGAKPNDLAAIQVNSSSTDWILAKVITHDPETGMYKLSDEDVESNKVFHLPESQVVVLGGVEKLSRGDIIYAVYPDTTSFYQATIVQSPRKVAGGGSFVMVNFVDDGDEHGITHDKAVLLKHIMRVPYGVTIQ